MCIKVLTIKPFPGAVLACLAVLVFAQDLTVIPEDLSFSCEGRAYGYYADPATNCQVFHICLGDGDIKWSFLCPNQTIFNQVSISCIRLFQSSHNMNSFSSNTSCAIMPSTSTAFQLKNSTV